MPHPEAFVHKMQHPRWTRKRYRKRRRLNDIQKCLQICDRKLIGGILNKMDVINKLGEDLKLNQKIAKIAVDTIIDTIKNAIIKGERVEIRGFGSFSLRNYKSYTGRNPKSGEVVHVEPKKLPYFKVGKELKDMIWKP